jgi:hypothetical protein
VSSAPSYRPNLIGDPLTPSDRRTVDNYLNSATVVLPGDSVYPFGNAGRNVARGPAFYQADIGLHKDFRLPWETTRISFRGEVFNLLNKTNFGAPTSNRSSADFGVIRSTYKPRQMQFGLKLSF